MTTSFKRQFKYALKTRNKTFLVFCPRLALRVLEEIIPAVLQMFCFIASRYPVQHDV